MLASYYGQGGVCGGPCTVYGDKALGAGRCVTVIDWGIFGHWSIFPHPRYHPGSSIQANEAGNSPAEPDLPVVVLLQAE